jgi:O-antigen ligase
LSVIAEEGIAGLLVLVALLVLLGRRILALARPQRDFFACLLLIYLTAGLANCLLIDFVHRHAFLMLLACFPLPARLPGEQP